MSGWLRGRVGDVLDLQGLLGFLEGVLGFLILLGGGSDQEVSHVRRLERSAGSHIIPLKQTDIYFDIP